MNWFILFIAGLCEVGFTTCLGKAKEAAGNLYYWWIGGFLFFLIMSMVLLYKATQTLPLGTAYAVWTGIGAVGTAIAGIVLFNEPRDFPRLFFIFLIVAGIAGLKFFTK